MGILIILLKTKFFQLIRVDPCIFCWLSWMAIGQHLLLGVMGEIPLSAWAIPVGIASGAIGRFMYTYYDFT
jgi:hypothetical protein